MNDVRLDTRDPFSGSFQRTLPKSYNSCQCECHRRPGVVHVAPCCRPKRSETIKVDIKLPMFTMCACCLKKKETPLRIDAMGGYVCLTCIDKKLKSLLSLSDWASMRLHETKDMEFKNAPHLQSFANGVEHAYMEVLIKINSTIQEGNIE